MLQGLKRKSNPPSRESGAPQTGDGSKGNETRPEETSERKKRNGGRGTQEEKGRSEKGMKMGKGAKWGQIRKKVPDKRARME